MGSSARSRATSSSAERLLPVSRTDDSAVLSTVVNTEGDRVTDPRRFDWLFRPQERDEDTPLSAEARFAEAFGRLSAEERSALALSDIGGLGHEEIATRMGTEREIVEDLIARARESMRAALVDRSRRLLGQSRLAGRTESGRRFGQHPVRLPEPDIDREVTARP